MIKKVGYLLLPFLCLTAQALVPVEGIIMGVARESVQSDPLSFIFRDIYDRSQFKENKKLKLYHHSYTAGTYLTESCSFYGPTLYANSWREKQAKRAVASTLQYIGLDTSIKAIGAYAKKVEMEEEDFKRLSSNLVKNYCSKNITIFSLRNIERSLAHYYANPLLEMIPEVESSPFATKDFKARTQSSEARSVELEYAIKTFRTFCSWGGEVEDYRMMGPYLKNPFIMSFVIKNLLGVQDTVMEKELKVATIKSPSTVQVTCDELICRKSSMGDFLKKFPLSVGSTGLNTDLAKLYCNHFRYDDYSGANTIPQVKQWIKDSELEDPVFETSFFISFMTGVPDPIFSTDKYKELPFLAKSSIDERWSSWAADVLKVFSKGMLFEESLKVKVQPIRDSAALYEGFSLNFGITLGEMDRIMNNTDKLKLKFELKLSKNYLRALRVKWVHLVNEADFDGQKVFKKEIAAYLDIQIKKKEKLFLQKMWNQDFSRLLAEELLSQVTLYRGSLFKSYQDQLLTVPIEFNYGLFALSYLRFRSDVNADRLKFKL